LGPPHEFSAVAVLEKSYVPRPDVYAAQVGHYAIRHLERFAPGTPYAEMTDRLAEIFAADAVAGGFLVIDETAIGKPVLNIFQDAGIDAMLGRLTVTAGMKAMFDQGLWLVPKKELVGVMQVLLQGRRLQIAPTLVEADLLIRELQNFRARPPARESSEVLDWRDGAHDDLVLATAIAAWEGERHELVTGRSLPMVLGTPPWWAPR
jgi:hypothetical protein